jgi:formylglycine-generating enzyme required for sulfatase activity
MVPNPLPQWALSAGSDEFGDYADLPIYDTSLHMRWIEPGTFIMGSPDDEAGRFSNEGPQHAVTISRGFWVSDSHVTQSVWDAVMGEGNNPSHFPGPDHPVEHVSWECSQAFIAILNKFFSDLFARLPSEAEWEYIARAGTTSAYSDGSSYSDTDAFKSAFATLAWCSTTRELKQASTILRSSAGFDPKPLPASEPPEFGPQDVRSLKPNAWGIYDIHGEVLEHCDCWYSEYNAKTVTDPRVSAPHPRGRILRGGGWASDARECRSSFRDAWPPGQKYDNAGFRIIGGAL